MGSYVLDLHEIDQTQVAVVGGKGAHLGELSRIEGIRVPTGFCVTTDAFRRIMAKAPSIGDRLDRLSRLNPDDREAIRTLSAEVRRTLAGLAIPDDLASEITRSLARLGERAGYAVRSSATAEDLPTASFAGQHETYLNVVGPAAILEDISRSWASLFTERAVTYRLRNGFDHRSVHMALVVQQMVFAEAAGVLFTADPVTSNRKVTTVEATFGLGEVLVSGLVNADRYKVRNGEVVAKAVATKQLAIHALPAGGTQEQAIDPARQDQPALTDAQVVRLAELGRQIEAHFGRPQDIEWCLVDDEFQVVQSRPITTLFPIPAPHDGENHVFVSVGHGQMMTDAMKPLGIAMWQLTALPPMYEAGGRLFVDVTQRLASPTSRAGLLEILGRGDPLIRDALETILERDDFIPSLPDQEHGGAPSGSAPVPLETDPAIVEELMERVQASIAALQRDIRTKSGPALIDFIRADIQELRRILFDPRSHQVFMSAMEATWWLNDKLESWLGEKNVADTLTRSVPDNVTSEMGLALLDVADAIRPHPEVVALLQQVDGNDDFLDGLEAVAGGQQARDAIRSFLDKYGMRCVGEIDITRPRWSERPATLVPMILGNVKNFEPGAGTRRFEQGRQEAWEKEQEVLTRLRAMPDGEGKAEEVRRMINRVRTFIGYREYPKYGMISRYFVYKQALLKEAERLVQAHVLREKEDIFFLTYQELHDVVGANHMDDRLIQVRKDAFRSYQGLTPPRVLTSDGEVITGAYRRNDVPTGALVGLPVSAGIVEGFRLPYPPSLVDDLRSRAGLNGTGRLLDVASGTGQIAFDLSTAFDQIVALDQEPGTVVFGQAKSDALGCTNIRWQIGTAEDADVSGSFDMVAIGNAFHRLRRQRVAERALSWLRSGGYAALLWGGNPSEGTSDWQEVLRAVIVDWLGRAGDRLPADWEDAMARDSHEQVLRRVGFSYEGSHDFSIPHVWTIETLTGYLYSTSVLSRQALGDLAPLFEEDLSMRMLRCRSNGSFEQAVRFSYQLAQKPK